MVTSSVDRARNTRWSVLVALMGVFVTVSCSGTEGSGAPEMIETYRVGSFDQLVATADTVVVGEVSSLEPGRVSGDPGPGGGGQIQFYDAVVSVDEVLKGKGTERLEIEVDEVFMPFAKGDRGMFFLLATGEGYPGYVKGSPGHILVHSTGALIYSGETVRSSNSEPAWAARAELKSPADLEADVRAVVDAGTASPAPLYFENVPEG